MANFEIGERERRIGFVLVGIVVVAGIWLLARDRKPASPFRDPSTEVRPDGQIELRPGPGPLISPPSIAASQPMAVAARIIRVRDSAGVPISGARVRLLVGDNSIVEDSIADSAGLSHFGTNDDISPPWTVVVTSAGFQTATVRIPAMESSPIEVILQPGARISGRVTGPAGAVVDGPVFIVATPTLSELDRSTGATSDPRVASTSTDDAGTFEFRSLVAGARYDLMAYSARGVSKRLFGVEAGGSVSPTITLRTVYAVILRFVDESGRPVVVSPGLGVIGGPNENANPPGGSMVVGLESSWAEASGVAAEFGRISGQGLARLLVFSNEDPLTELGPIRYRRQVPGFELFDGTAIALPVGQRIAVSDVRLKRQGAEVATRLDVGFDGSLPSPMDASRLNAQVGLLRLDRDDGLKLAQPVTEQMLPTFHIEGVPEGSYRVTLRIPGMSNDGPSVPCSVVAGGARVVVSLPRSGALEIRLPQQLGIGGSHPTGRVEIDAPDSADPVSFVRLIEGLSTRIPSVVTGHYRVRVFTQEPSSDQLRIEEYIDIRSGEVSVVEAQEPPK